MQNNFFAYALALFDLNPNPSKIFDELDRWYGMHQEFSDLATYLSNPFAPKNKQKKLVAEVCKVLKLSSSLLHWLWVIIDDRKYQYFTPIYKACKKQFCILTQTVNVQIVSAFKLTSRQQQQIQDKLKAIIPSNVIFDMDVDHSLIGGLKISYQNHVYDNTIKNKLFFLKNKLLETKEK